MNTNVASKPTILQFVLNPYPEKKSRFHMTIDSTPIAEWLKNLARIIEKAAKKIIAPKKNTDRSIKLNTILIEK
ncbi:hypothetical protein [uncultured Dysgonomonas sp.]|uniref:Uncharacterized protein n=1 Tax=uncultured Dysgonomonas sp. TaxID=206096 RepID=A0A212IVW9_9BACT|nr:hypothetical protein [uncultured Dysgonomonas sp.]SBV91361.1 hypothetical protein KL86DYS1_10322 [uncultured Dysgonomonas sp.]